MKCQGMLRASDRILGNLGDDLRAIVHLEGGGDGRVENDPLEEEEVRGSLSPLVGCGKCFHPP